MLFDFLLTLVKIFFPFTFVDQLFICQGIGQWFVACCPQFLVLGLAWHPSLCPVVNVDSLAKKILKTITHFNFSHIFAVNITIIQVVSRDAIFLKSSS